MGIRMKNAFEKISNTCLPLIMKILFVCLISVLLVWLSGRGPAGEVAVTAGTFGTAAPGQTPESGVQETERGTEAWTEGMSETESEALTPAELAALEGEQEETTDLIALADATDAGTGTHRDTKEAETQLPVLLVKIPQIPVDFQIPMTMSDTEIVEYQEDSSAYRWQFVNERYRIGGVIPYRVSKFKVSGPEENEGYEIVGYGAYRPFSLLKRMIEKRLANYDGDWSVYVKNLETDESFVVNDQPMKSASVMKLFIMGTVYKAIEAGELERTDEVVSLLNSMITASDNEASNRLLYLLGNSSYADGIARVDAFIREYGFSDMTVEYNGFNNSATVMDPGHNNQVSAKDCGKLLEDVYRRSWINRSSANEIEQMMLNQQTRYKIPAGLPEGVSCGNKTGEMDTTENDAAVVYGRDCDYILVVLSSDWNSKDEAISRIASMSSMVYEFMN